jgi:hypothetical protein
VHDPPPARPLGPDAEGQWVRHWTSPQWTQAADAWVARRLAERGRRISGVPVTYRARFWSVVRCYPTVEGLVWLKENNPGHRFEPPLVAALAGLAPYDVIVPLAVDRERRWLLTDDHGTGLTHADVSRVEVSSHVVHDIAAEDVRGVVLATAADARRFSPLVVEALSQFPELTPRAGAD